jgi:hypothetical protein
LATRFDDNQKQDILLEIRQKFEGIIPQIPYIGGEVNINTKNRLFPNFSTIRKHLKT